MKKTSAREGKYRLRVGSFLVLFELQVDLIFIHAVKDRKEAYDQARRSRHITLNLRALHREVTQLRTRVEDLEGLRELNDAITRNAGKPGTPWVQAKVEPGL